jgi:hypothetical protein
MMISGRNLQKADGTGMLKMSFLRVPVDAVDLIL